MHSSACNAPLQKNSHLRLFQSLFIGDLSSHPRQEKTSSPSDLHQGQYAYIAIVVDTGTVFVLDAQCSKGTQQHSSHVWRRRNAQVRFFCFISWYERAHMKRRGRVKYPHLVFFLKARILVMVSVMRVWGETGYFWNEVEFTCHAMECDPGA